MRNADKQEETAMALTEGQRVDYLIRTLEGDNAKAFARKIGMAPPALSALRNGNGMRLPSRIDSILKAYPAVRREWLETGKGYPGDLTVELVRESMQARIDRADRLIDTLTRDLEQKIRIIDMLIEEHGNL